jgi:hypothetical protein
MSANRDILDRLWFEVVHLDPEGQWMKDFISRPDSSQHPVAEAKAAMEEVLASGFSTEDLGRMGRFVRWSICSSTLYKFGDPGLEDSKLAGLAEAFVAGPDRIRRERNFFDELSGEYFWSKGKRNADPEQWKPWLPDVRDKMFVDAPAALERLRAQGITNQTLMALENWHHYEATYHTLRLVEEFYETAEEISDLDHHVPYEDPATGDARPVAVLSSDAAENIVREMPDPLFVCRGAEKFTFSPDSRFVAVSGRTAPIRIVDIQDGGEIANCKFLKGDVGQFLFSPASDSLVAVQQNRFNFFEAGTGSLLRQIPRGNFESMQWWRSDGGEVLFFIRWLSKNYNNPGYKFEIYDSSSLNLIAEAVFPETQGHLKNFRISPDGTKVGLDWGGVITVWTWPQCVLLGKWYLNSQNWAWTPDGEKIATLDVGRSRFDEVLKKHVPVRDKRGYVLKDVISGEIVWATEEPRDRYPRIAISPDGKWLVGGYESISIWSIEKNKKALEFKLNSSPCFDIQFSPDGRVLGLKGDRQCLFWNFQQLTEASAK